VKGRLCFSEPPFLFFCDERVMDQNQWTNDAARCSRN
jgi:hypothetical protein